ncbi:hypothetical protein GDO78_010593 [Eleutherodactylus coqui]|uniref:Uncharacterized protein n=1 Tax=Eleutherodactylus coqui TaxID=57060 RepID=A0A8J6K6B6_ELECQ|nr:hypothetical protein GDO78_010593 [Eleutherodactylus coqui]
MELMNKRPKSALTLGFPVRYQGIRAHTRALWPLYFRHLWQPQLVDHTNVIFSHVSLTMTGHKFYFVSECPFILVLASGRKSVNFV